MTALEMLTRLEKPSIAHQPIEKVLITNFKVALHSATNNTVKLLAKRKIDNNQKKASEWNNLATNTIDTSTVQWNSFESDDTSFSFNNQTNEIIEKNLAATISSIRNNVTRVLYMYFNNVSDAEGYGAAYTMATPTMGELQHHHHHQQQQQQQQQLQQQHPQRQEQPPSSTIATKTSLLSTTFLPVTGLETTTTLNTNDTIIKQSSTSTSPSTIASETISTTLSPLLSPNNATATHYLNIPTATPSITYPSYKIEIRSYENCSALFANYTQPQPGE